MMEPAGLRSIAILGVAAVMMVGCTEPNPAYQGGPLLAGECRVGEEVSETFESFERPEKVDLLFVVASAGDVIDFQDALALAMPAFLEDLDDEEYDVHVGVKTADANEGAGLAPVISSGEECAGNSEEVAVSGEDDWLVSARCNVQQGVEGARRQQPLDVIHESIVEDPESLEGFRREDARLVIVVVANEDDCSGENFDDDANESKRDVCAWQAGDLRDVESWAEDLRDEAAVPEGISLAVIAGPPVDINYERPEAVRSVCRSTLGSAYPSTRLFEAVDHFGDQGLFLSTCVLDFTEHLREISQRLVKRDSVTLCPAQEMAQEPLEVSGDYLSGEDRLISFGSGFVFLGPTERCEEGAIRLLREGAQDLERVDLRYCTQE